MTTRRQFVFLAGASLVVFAQAARSQRRLWRIGYFSAGSAQSNAGWLDAFRRGMSELGWSEARDYVIDTRYADGAAEDLQRRTATELVATQPDILLTTADASIRLLSQSTRTIPIVFTGAADPVGERYAASLQRPGGNLTGLTLQSRDLTAKRLELLKEAFPSVSHVVLFFQGNDPAGLLQLKEFTDAAANLKLRMTSIDLRQAADIEPAFDRAGALGADAYAIAGSFMLNIHRKAIADGILRAKVPSIGTNVIMAEAGVLMTYAPSLPRHFHRAASYVDRILKGAKPGELPIEQPTRFDLVINARTAKALGATIPPSIRLRAERVIE